MRAHIHAAASAEGLQNNKKEETCQHHPLECASVRDLFPAKPTGQVWQCPARRAQMELPVPEYA
eukprot:CAMPEP_0115427516 /NCGR_PEP_ID=MMETSP0271-20121206/29490_1 /TAXON_ID=71861 /ORGANISM="Scrippsiella trochoidea, Strain CCMP3099" /LENGTH=63 /DNA_ID=CAMNT_0002852557 /DNA_START=50 /DNA_END=238 /DNA_ORIENTATION=+